MKSPDTIELVHEFDHPRERVFDAWLKAETLSRFMMPAPGVRVTDVRVDAREGGEFSLNMVAGQAIIPIRGRYQRIVPHSSLAFTWLSARTLETSLVTLKFDSLGEGRTRLTLGHSGFPDAESRGDHEGGWGRILKTLAEALPL